MLDEYDKENYNTERHTSLLIRLSLGIHVDYKGCSLNIVTCLITFPVVDNQ